MDATRAALSSVGCCNAEASTARRLSGLGQHHCQIVEGVADPEARGRLVSQIEVLVANRHDVGVRYSAQLQQVSIGNLTAPDDRHSGCAHSASRSEDRKGH
jgi:hypothetical protein